MSKKIKRLKHDILHASGIYKTIEDVPKELHKEYEEKGLIVEVAPDISQSPEVKDLETHVNKLESLLSTETERAEKAESELSQANSDVAGLTSQLEDAGNSEELQAKVTELEGLLKEAKKAAKKQ